MKDSGTLESLFPSDKLSSLRNLLSELPALKEMLGEVIRIRLVIDASVVQEDLRWRLRSRQDPTARSGLHEAIDSGTIIAFAPNFLKGEIEEHLEDIAGYAGVSHDRACEEWQSYQSLLHFYEPENPQQFDTNCVDRDDLPYKLVFDQLGAEAVYTRDAHFQEMGVPVITVNLALVCRDYARATSVHIGIRLGSGFTLMVSLHVLSAFVKACVQGFRRLPNSVKLGVAVAVLVAVLHPKSRETIANVFRSIQSQLSDAKSPLTAALVDFASQFSEADRMATEKRLEIQSLLPPRRKHTALVHARSVCMVSEVPLSLTEIGRRIRSEGYVSRSRNFTQYLRRVLRTDKRFVEVSIGEWTVRPEGRALTV